MVVGTGSELARLKKMAGANITFLGKVADEKLIQIYQQANALIFPGLEDFGLVPSESQAVGTPVIAYKAGGATETVIDGKTGLFFKRQTIKSLGNAIKKFENLKFDPKDCINNANKFSEAKFKSELLNYIDKVIKS